MDLCKVGLVVFFCLVILEKTIRIPRSLSVKAASVLKGFLNKVLCPLRHLVICDCGKYFIGYRRHLVSDWVAIHRLDLVI